MWIQLKQSVFTHRKTVAVAEALDMEEVHVVGHLGALWSWALDNASNDGIITASERTIEKAAYWAGPRGSFVAALVAAGYLHVVDGGFSVHDWDGHIGKLMDARAANAARQRAKRERAKASRDASPTPDEDVTRDVTGTCALRNGIREDKRREEKSRSDATHHHHPQTPSPPATPGGGGGDVLPTVTRDGSDHADPLPIVVQEALAGCPPWWEQALRESWRCNAERITSPASYLLKTLRRWKADPAAAPPDPALPPQRAPTNATDARVARARAYIAPRLAPMEAAAAALERQGATPPAPRLRILEEADA